MEKHNIPRKIHYCWFGGKPLPKSAIKCIESWKKYFPDYEIIQWDESNYDVKKIRYIEEAYNEGKFAFVSDYARFDILYKEGGIYFDTDVEVIKSFDDIIKNGSFMGAETNGNEVINKTQNKLSKITIAPGLGIGAPCGLEIYKEILDFYVNEKFINDNGQLNQETVVTKITKILYHHGLTDTNKIQKVCDITIYPKDFFNPMNNNTGEINITENTHSIHWYAMSWVSSSKKVKSRFTRIFHKYFGEDCFDFLKRR